MKQLSIIIPVFHEEKNIVKVLARIKKSVKTPHETLVIYDNENDPTVKKVQNSKFKVQNTVKLIKNSVGNGRGVMNAIKTGFKKARGEAIVVTMADLCDDVSQIDTMHRHIVNGCGIVCASRYMRGGKKIGGPRLKTLLSKTAGLTLHYFFGLPTHDATNAFKMYRRKIFDRIKVESTGGFEYSLEIIIKAYRLGYKIKEIPTVWKDREAGKSNFKLWKWLPNYIKSYLYVIRKT